MAVNIAIFGAFLLMVLVFGFFLWQTLFASKENGYSEPEGKPAYSEQESSSKNTLRGGPAPSSGKATDEAIAEYTKWLAIFTLFLVLATIGLFISGERNVQIARSSANAAERAAKAAQTQANTSAEQLQRTFRAWVGISGTPQIIQPLNFDGENPTITVRLKRKNVGISPAFNVIGVNITLIIGNATNPGELVTEADPKAAESFVERFGLMILPNEEIDDKDVVPTFRALNLRDGQVSAWLTGYFAYRDQLNVVRTTSFLFHFIADATGTRFDPAGIVQGRFERVGYGWNAT